MSVAYAPDGLLGVLTPQANTTVEPELALLMPGGTAWINGRLMSGRATIADRLKDYFANYAAAMDQFANAPIGAVAFACTGASYLAGVEREDATVADIGSRHGIPVVTAATAVVDALRAVGARRIGLVSPYDEALDTASIAYWTARGFTVAAKTSAWRESSEFHPIYSLPGGASQAALDRLSGETLDAVVMLGTGMPTLHTIARTPRLGTAPVLSCMLCLAWRSTVALKGAGPDAASLLALVDGRGWRDRLPSPAG